MVLGRDVHAGEAQPDISESNARPGRIGGVNRRLGAAVGVIGRVLSVSA